ncbi:hypothetical protein [Anaerocolumna xylanovorans]|uniref:Uncharacterized protein n=1 Tax=Anaerocolumna xylanovorans DSM 12503 TaxID=1121345 RepID=A0A1M7Y3L4_9FIRM|nr:hypothetical protein [Anaerocolumna xylanovorans]SHO46784.1 hypothetical protein SAMN02745217_01287 [Anaerocolumna xylanovorans DSM 12503]
MSKKSELIQLFKEFKDRYSTIQARIAEVQKSDAYTDIGREQTIGKILEEFQPTVQLYHDKAIAAIDNGLTALQAKWKANSAGRLADAGYQIGLGNVIKMIEAGAIHDRDDMQNIIETYKDDYNAMATIKNILPKSEQAMDFVGLIPADNREQNKQLLGQLRNNADQYINAYRIENAMKSSDAFQGASSIVFAVDGMIEFANTSLSDDLSLIQ